MEEFLKDFVLHSDPAAGDKSIDLIDLFVCPTPHIPYHISYILFLGSKILHKENTFCYLEIDALKTTKVVGHC